MKTKHMQFMEQDNGGGDGGGEGKTSFEAAFLAAMETPKEEPAAKPETVKAEPEKKPETETKTGVPTQLFKKEAAPKAEPVTPTVEKDPEFKNPAHKDQWNAVKSERDAAKARAAELEKQITELQGKAALADEGSKKLADYEKRIAELQERQAGIDLSNEPAHKAKVQERDKLFGRAEAIAKESDVDSKTLSAALNLKGEARIEAIQQLSENLSALQAGRLGRVIDAIDALDADIDAERANASQVLSERQKAAQEQAAQERAAYIKQAATTFEQTADKLKAKLEVLNSAEGHDDWNKQAAQIIEDAKAFYHGDVNLEAAAEAAIMAKSAPVFQKLAQDALAENDTLRSTVADLKKELAGIYGKSPSTVRRSGDGKPSIKEMTFEERFDAEMSGA